MRDARMTRALRRTFDRTACVFRPLSDGTERAVYVDIPCALSRSALTSAPSVGAEGAALVESRYALTLYTMPEFWLRLGDRVTVRANLPRPRQRQRALSEPLRDGGGGYGGIRTCFTGECRGWHGRSKGLTPSDGSQGMVSLRKRTRFARSRAGSAEGGTAHKEG